MNWSKCSQLRATYENLNVEKASESELRSGLATAARHISNLLSNLDDLRDSIVEISSLIGAPKNETERIVLSKLVELTKV